MSAKSVKREENKLPALQDRALNLIGSRSDGVLQSELRRLLGIDSSKCSRIVIKMQAAGLIRRERHPASRTYLIRIASSSRKAKSNPHIDSYLTEIYLLYLIRGISC